MDQLVEQSPLQEEKPLIQEENPLIQEENPVKPEEQIKIVRKDEFAKKERTALDKMKAGYDYAAGKTRRR